MLELKNLRSESLAQVEDGAATELGKVDTLRHVFAHLVVGLYLACLLERHLLVLVLYLSVSHYHTVAVYLEVAFVRVYDNVEVLVASEYLCENVAEALLQNAYQSSAVDVLCLLKLLERVEHAHHVVFFNCCHSLFEIY